jgi:hypothetical protein
MSHDMSNTQKRKRYASEWPETGAKKKKTEGSFSPAPDTASMSQQEWHYEAIRLDTAIIVKKRQRDWWEDVRVTKRARSAEPETMVPGELQVKEPEKEKEQDDVTKWRAPVLCGSTGTFPPWVVLEVPGAMRAAGAKNSRKQARPSKPSKVVEAISSSTPKAGALGTTGTTDSEQQAQLPKPSSVIGTAPSSTSSAPSNNVFVTSSDSSWSAAFAAFGKSPTDLGQLQKPSAPLFAPIKKVATTAPSTPPTNVPSQEESNSIVPAQVEPPTSPKKKVSFADNKALQQKLDELEATEEVEFARKSQQESMSLYGRFKDDLIEGRDNWINGYKESAIDTRRHHYADGEEGDDANTFDSDYQDVDYDYGEDNWDGMDEDNRARAEDEHEEPTYDPNFVAEEINNGEKYGIKIPDYTPKGSGWEEWMQMEAKQTAEERASWKAFEGFGQQEGSAATGASAEYKSWHRECKAFFAQDKSAELSMMTQGLPFPKIRGRLCGVSSRDCVRGEKLGICQHDVLRVLKGAGVDIDGEEWLERLKRERLRWHPDKFSSKMGKRWEAEAKELFQMIQALAEKESKG